MPGVFSVYHLLLAHVTQGLTKKGVFQLCSILYWSGP